MAVERPCDNCGHAHDEHHVKNLSDGDQTFCMRHDCACQFFVGQPGEPFAGEFPMPTLRERDHILNTAKRIISGDRQQSYGDARTDFTRTGQMWAAVFGHEVTPEQVALCMLLLKVGRLCHTPSHLDSWVDICGYAALGGEIGTGNGS